MSAINVQQNIPQNAPYSIQLNSVSQIQAKDENSILIQNIDKFVTESMLHQKFSQVGEIKIIKLKVNKATGISEGRALIEYRSQSTVQEAVKRFNMKKFFENNEASADQKFMQVIPKLSKEEAEKLKSRRVFFKVLQNTQLQAESLVGPLSILGDVHQIKIASKKGRLLNYGVIVFKDQEAKTKALQLDQNGKPQQNVGIDILFEDYEQDQESYNIHVTEHGLINQVVSDEIIKDLNKKLDEQIRLTKIIKDDLSKKSITYTSLSLTIEEGHKKPYFFISVDSKEVADQLIKDFEAAGAKCTLKSKKKDLNAQYKHLHVKSLKVPQYNEEQTKNIIDDYKRETSVQKEDKVIVQEYADKQIEEKIIAGLQELKITKVSVKVSAPSPKPAYLRQDGKQFEESRQATLFFESSEDGINLLSKYLSHSMLSTVKSWFINDNPHGNINVLLNQTDREGYKKAASKGQSVQIQSFQKALAQQQFQNAQQDQNRYLQSNSEASGHVYQRNNFQNNQFQQQNYPQGQFQQANQGYPRSQNPQNTRYNQNINNNNSQRRPYNGNTGYSNLQGAQQQPRSVQYQSQNRSYQQQAPRSQGPHGQNNYSQNVQQFNQARPQTLSNPQQQIPVQIPDQKKQNINPQQIQGVVTQQNQNVPQQVMSLDQIRSQVDEFVKKPQEQQKSILGQLIYPKVKEALDSKKEDSKILTPKITGMLIDFTVFELEDIIDMIDNKEDLAERIDEALELIKNPPPSN